ncbi:N-glycosylase/DNA lyase isoform X1 [Rissa tridactyla]|uniref:N-glycosylase/DNA lyase isoform X1 n=1 Tax=Rissa tridactyla TaxID=75485 RepID=UPI0023BAEDE4|nr:N-glycosylase/DNA lyase isoform X1 [Rissa tridactyla]
MKLRDGPSACPSLWRSLPCPPAELRLDLVLSSGQTFRWWESSPGAWTGVLGERVWTLRQEQDRLWYTVYGEEQDGRPDGAETDQILRDYFQLDVGLPALYRAWGAADPLFRKVANDFPGVRVLRQDPVECLLSFICTSNNHISRITAMIERLCQAFGRHLCCLDARPIHAFPSLSALAGADTEARLRALGFGYRAKFVSGTARAIVEGLGAEGLRRLRTVPYAEARRELCALPGVGTKVTSSVGCGAPALDGRRRSSSAPTSARARSWLAAETRPGGTEDGTIAGAVPPKDTPEGAEPPGSAAEVGITPPAPSLECAGVRAAACSLPTVFLGRAAAQGGEAGGG